MIKTTRKDPKWADKYVKRITELTGKEVAVGFPANDEGSSRPNYENGASILDVAVWNNYGTEDIPSRNFMEEAAPEQHKVHMDICKQGIKRVNSGELRPEALLKASALKARAVGQRVIRDHPWVPNSPRTIKRKGSDKPLIDKGDMLKALNAIVRPVGS